MRPCIASISTASRTFTRCGRRSSRTRRTASRRAAGCCSATPDCPTPSLRYGRSQRHPHTTDSLSRSRRLKRHASSYPRERLRLGFDRPSFFLYPCHPIPCDVNVPSNILVRRYGRKMTDAVDAPLNPNKQTNFCPTFCLAVARIQS